MPPTITGKPLILSSDSESEYEDVFSNNQSEIAIEDASSENKSEHGIEEIDHEAIKKRLESIESNPEDKPAIMYLGRIPHGFYETQIKAYFSQFGDVGRVRVSRNKKTGRSKHYAFVEFINPEVAKIVVETMNNYLLCEHILKCSIMPEEKVHPDLFKGAGRKFKPIPYKKLDKARHNFPKSGEKYQKIVKRLVKRENEKRNKLQQLGIDYEFKGYEAIVKPEPKHVVF